MLLLMLHWYWLLQCWVWYNKGICARDNENLKWLRVCLRTNRSNSNTFFGGRTFFSSFTPDCVQINDAIKGGLAAIVSVPKGAMQEVTVRLAINVGCPSSAQSGWKHVLVMTFHLCYKIHFTKTNMILHVLNCWMGSFSNISFTLYPRSWIF
jgi:hypothetical protein